MKTRMISFPTAALLLVAIVLAAAWFTNGTARAAVGNTGVPVWCYASTLSAGNDVRLFCFPPNGTVAPFERVPAGYYFMVTDVTMSPITSGASTGNLVELDLKDGYGTSGVFFAINHFKYVDGATAGQHYISPMWTLVADHFLEVAVSANTQQYFELRVMGILTTNATYIPLAANAR